MLRALANGNIRINKTARAEGGLMADITAGADDRVVANDGVRFDDDVWLNRNACTNLCAIGNDGTRMNSGRKSNRLRREFQHDLLECLRRISHANLGRRNFFGEIAWHKCSGRAGFSQQRQIAAVAEERNFAGVGFGQGSGAGNLLRGIAEQLAIGHGCKLLKGKHGRQASFA